MNPDSDIKLTLSSYIDSCEVEDKIGEISYKNKQSEDPDEIITADLYCSYAGSTSYFDALLDGQKILRVEINHVELNSKILITYWRDYESTTDFDRYVIVAINLDWD